MRQNDMPHADSVWTCAQPTVLLSIKCAIWRMGQNQKMGQPGRQIAVLLYAAPSLL